MDEALAHPYLQHVRDPSLEVTLATPLVDRGTSGLSLERVKRALYEEIGAFHGHAPQPPPQQPQPAHAHAHPLTAKPSPEAAYLAGFYYAQKQSQPAGYWGASQNGMQQYHHGHQYMQEREGEGGGYHRAQQALQAQQRGRGHAGPVGMMEC